MSQENMETVRRPFKAVEERDLAGVLAAYDPEIVIREAESLPCGGVYRGLEGATRHMSTRVARFAALWIYRTSAKI